MKIKTLEGYRQDVIQLLPKNDRLTGIELGVAGGIFSKRMVETGIFEHFFGVDMYADHHNTEEYKKALQSIGLFSPYKLLRMTFDEALELFPDQSLDFVYIDGYAHTGEEGGATIYKWYDKVKVGGVLAGDDYHADWPLVKKAVNNFVEAADLDLYTTQYTENKTFCEYPSWAVVKKTHQPLEMPQKLVEEGKSIAEQTYRQWVKRQFINDYVKPTLKPMLPAWGLSLWRSYKHKNRAVN